MKQTFLTDIHIKKVRHLENVTIPLDKEKRKHLILTGKNGGGNDVDEEFKNLRASSSLF